MLFEPLSAPHLAYCQSTHLSSLGLSIRYYANFAKCGSASVVCLYR